MEYMWQIKSHSWSFIICFCLFCLDFSGLTYKCYCKRGKKPQTKIDYPRFGALEWDDEDSAQFLSYFSPGIYTNPNYLGKHKSTSIAYTSERKGINRQTLNIFYASFLSPSLTFWSPLPSSLKMNSCYSKHGGYLVALLHLFFSSPAKGCCASGKAPQEVLLIKCSGSGESNSQKWNRLVCACMSIHRGYSWQVCSIQMHKNN